MDDSYTKTMNRYRALCHHLQSGQQRPPTGANRAAVFGSGGSLSAFQALLAGFRNGMVAGEASLLIWDLLDNLRSGALSEGTAFVDIQT